MEQRYKIRRKQQQRWKQQSKKPNGIRKKTNIKLYINNNNNRTPPCKRFSKKCNSFFQCQLYICFCWIISGSIVWRLKRNWKLLNKPHACMFRIFRMQMGQVCVIYFIPLLVCFFRGNKRRKDASRTLTAPRFFRSKRALLRRRCNTWVVSSITKRAKPAAFCSINDWKWILTSMNTHTLWAACSNKPTAASRYTQKKNNK